MFILPEIRAAQQVGVRPSGCWAAGDSSPSSSIYVNHPALFVSHTFYPSVHAVTGAIHVLTHLQWNK